MERFVRLSITIVVVVAATSCGGGMSMPDYAQRVETLVVGMNSHLDELNAEYWATTDIDQVRSYAREWVAARQRMIDGLRSLDPPESARDLHDEAIEILSRLAEAEWGLVTRAEASDDFISVGALWNTEEGKAAREVDERAVLICEAAQAKFDRTRAAEEFADVPWVPPEMKEVIDVTFGCDVDDR